MTTSTTTVRREQHGTVAVLTLARPPMNALDAPFCREIAAAARAVADDPAVAGVVLAADGPAFSAGVDLQIVPDLAVDAQDDLLDAINRMVETLYGLPVPLVAAVEGHAIAGGLLLALCCDHRIVGPRGRHGLTEVAVGVRFPAATREVVQAELPASVVRRLVLGGELLDAEAALRLGLYDTAADDPLAAAIITAERLGGHDRRVYAELKTVIRSATLARIAAVVRAGDPLRGQWLPTELRELARARLSR